MQQRAQFFADCAGTPNRSYLTFYDVIYYSDVISALDSYVFRRNMRFIGVIDCLLYTSDAADE